MGFPEHIRKEIGRKRGWRCQYPGCRKSYPGGYYMEIHHILPSSASGTDEESNAEILCTYHHWIRHVELEERGIGHKSANIVYARLQRKGEKMKP